MDILRFLCGVLGNAVGLFLFLAPIMTFKRIIRSQSTEQFSGVPYVISLLNCLLYTWYGLPFVSSDNLLISIISGIGVVIEFTYVSIFITNGPKKERAKIIGLCALALILFITFAFVSLFALHGKTRKLLCGITLDISSTIMYASPLSVMVPNGLGTGLGTAQLILYAIYCKNQSHMTNEITDEFAETDLETTDQMQKLGCLA
ncbi:bidirectional sugar transporter SWEET1 isoform X2 [Eucalyptus grandis]|uniref:bidirectional sugar transporter SWEET1 isoform X2 n=1 Tax=Eucalyptus grandis TaxID=71139 RepID=UPI000527C5A4|nr:bidirectional sugar transporter SWEET1 isoform X2 [Eucalyptus grandis]